MVDPTNPSSDSFLTLASPTSGLYKDRGSKFLYFAFPVSDEEEIKLKLAELRKTYYDATHHCYAWILGTRGDQFRANDDGEPNHSAGDPILGQIRSFGLSHTLVVVVRYFGGTKLGVSGLIQAYKNSAFEALQGAEIIRKWEMAELKIRFPYLLMNDVMKIIKQDSLEIKSQELELDCLFKLEFRSGLLSEISEKFSSLDGLELITD